LDVHDDGKWTEDKLLVDGGDLNETQEICNSLGLLDAQTMNLSLIGKNSEIKYGFHHGKLRVESPFHCQRQSLKPLEYQQQDRDVSKDRFDLAHELTICGQRF
jgi:hypothetical protein